MQKLIIVFFALCAFAVPAVSHANFFSDVWGSYVLTLASIGTQTAAVNSAFPTDKYIDVKVNGSDGPAAVNPKTATSVRWMPRSMLLSAMLKDCKISYPSGTSIQTKNVEPRGVERLMLSPKADGSSFVDFRCTWDSREFRDTVQLTVGTTTPRAGFGASSEKGTYSGSKTGGTQPKGWLQGIQAMPIFRNVPTPSIPNVGGSPNVGGNSVIIEMPSGQTAEEQEIQRQMRDQAQ